MKIDWQDTGLSNHECVELAAIASRLGDTGTFDPVLPAARGARVITLSRFGTSPGYDRAASRHDRLLDDRHAAIDYDTQRLFRVQYQYRSASNYKLSGEAFLEGVLDPDAHALLLTVLGGSEDGCFIPSQLGLDDLQFTGGWEVDFEEEDHVWHEFEGLYPAKSAQSAFDLGSFLAECRNTLAAGWDDTAAIRRLDGM